MALITGSWTNTKLVCGNHPNGTELPEMELQTSGHTLFYVCPKCSAINRNEDEPACKNRLSALEYEKMLNHIASIVADAEEQDEVPHLQNYSWKKKTLAFKILEHDKNKMVVSVVDRVLCHEEI